MSVRSFGLRSAIGRIFRPTIEVTEVETVLDFVKTPQESLDRIFTRSDHELGGYSTVHLDLDDNYARFHGNLSLELPKDNPEVTRSGYAMFRTKNLRESWFSGDKYWDWSQMSALVMRLRGDNRKYLVNIQANTPLVTDLYQHRLFLNKPGNWETVVIPLDDFVMTNWGVVQEGELNKSEVKTVGIGLLDKQNGPFNLDIEWIKVMTGAEVEKISEVARLEKKISEDAPELLAALYPGKL